jgi:hypothetical protein
VIWGVFASPLPSLGRAATPLAEPLIPEPHDETEDEDIEDEARDVAR